jgi:hypothetical protein
MTEGKQESKRPAGRARGPQSRKPALTPEIQKQIGRQLRNLYIGFLQEGVPDRFTELLRRLDAQDASKES